MDALLNLMARMTPEEALSQITAIAGRLLADLDESARARFLMNLIHQSGGDKVSGLVHL
jgi:hypothetical protein